MKKNFQIFLFLLAFILCTKLQAQNLVPNPSFEEIDTSCYNASNCCPLYPGDFYVKNWWQFKSDDYYNACDDSLFYMSVPNNILGHQYPVTGNAYCGLFADAISNIDVLNYREIISTNLITPLTIGIKYYVSFKISLAEKSNCATNNIGLYFATDSIDFNIYPPILPNFAHIKTDSIIIDSVKWTTINGSFIADSEYKYIYIGNLFDDAHTSEILFDTTIYMPGQMFIDSICYAYYYVDDVCISSDSLTCNLPVAIQNNGINNSSINVFPNPVNGIFFIVNNNNKSEFETIISIFNITGQQIITDKFKNQNIIELDVSKFAKGIYIMTIKIDNQIENRKLIID